MFFVYILQNHDGKHYVGSTVNIQKRLIRHNNGGSVWTKNRGPWNLTYQEKFSTRIEAERREREIKSYKGGDAFRKLINN